MGFNKCEVVHTFPMVEDGNRGTFFKRLIITELICAHLSASDNYRIYHNVEDSTYILQIRDTFVKLSRDEMIKLKQEVDNVYIPAIEYRCPILPEEKREI